MKRGEGGSEESLDDILASIRKIIADEPGQAAVPHTPDAPLATPVSASPREPAFSSPTEADKPRSTFGTPAAATSAAPATPSANGAMGIQLPSARDALSGASASPAKPAPAERSEGFGFFRAALSAQTKPAFAPEAPSLNGATAPAAPSRSIAASIDDELADLIDEPAPAADSRGTSQAAPEPEAALASSFSAREAAPSVEAAREKWSQLINPTLTVTPDGSRAAAPVTSAPVSAAPISSAPSTGIFAPRSGGFYPPQAKIEPSLAKPVAAPAPADAKPATPVASTGAKDKVSADIPAAAPMAKVEASPSEPSLPDLPISTRIDTLAASNPTAAAAAALDALALGLAKTGEPTPEPAPRPASSAAPADTLIGSTLAAGPVTVPVPGPQAAPSAELVAPAGPAAAGPGPSVAPAAPISSQPRTLEDVVADMVRPMLEKWIDENMPRIVERALKLDATSGPKS